MARNTYTLDGIPLTDPDGRWFLEKSSGLRVIPAKRMPNISYPGADGDAFTAGASFLPGGVRVSMYVEGGDHEEFMYRVEYLNALFLQRHKLLELRHDYDEDANVSRVAKVKFTSGTDIQTLGLGVKQGIITYMAEIPGVFWRSTQEFEVTTEAYPTAWTTNLIPSLYEGNAPVADALIRVKGQFASMELEDYTTRSKLTINTPLTDNEYILIDPINWSAKKQDAATWDMTYGTNVDMSVISNRGYGSMFVMEPSLYGQEFHYRINHRTVNPVGSPHFTIRAKKSFL